MTGRERLLCTMAGEIADRVPVSFFVQEEYLSWFYPERKTVSRLEDAVDCAVHYGFDITTRQLQYTRPYWMTTSTVDWEVEVNTLVEGKICYRRTSILTPGGRLEQLEDAPYDPRTIGGIHFHTKEYFLKTPEDFEVFRKYFPAPPTDMLSIRREEARHSRGVIGDTGISAPWGVGGVYNMASTCRDVQDLLMDPYLQPEFYSELMDFFASWIIADYEILMDTDYDALGIQGNIANGSLMGEAFFRSHVLLYEKRLVDTIRSGGKYSIYHNCGFARNLYSAYRDLSMDVWETVSPPPMGDNDLREVKSILGSDLILSGNLDQVTFLKKAGRDEIMERVRQTMEAGKPGGRYIFAASDFLEKDTPEEHIHWAVDAAAGFGNYS